MVLLFAVCFYLTGTAQLSVADDSPLAAVDFKQCVYVAFNNPIRITAGNRGPLTITCDNGTIKSTAKKGNYLLKPRTTGTVTVTLTGKNFRRSFVFEVWAISFPAIRLANPSKGGIVGSHGVVFMENSDGVVPQIKPRDVDLGFKIDSFTLEITDTTGLKTVHQNMGWRWDSISKKMIREAKPNSRALVHKVWMSREGRKYKSDGYLEALLWFDSVKNTND